MSISTIRRQVKNVAYNFSDAQVKVREATCNDPWGPSTALMSEISDLTNNPMGLNIREKAKQITALLTDEERLKNERTRFMLTRTKYTFVLCLTFSAD
ncbi:unnamed protein product [Heligmosomoides polygyrus]|uniref:ENTH domain-containing protein n=1 Tax=Heligmosomoides polygyrus TaxID=6339 RepID=A0A183FVZ7_HELPZ|nr:unnamed protein product [Heligmosomoides polygyrus]